MKERVKRVNSLIKKELSKIILKEIEFPKEILVTLTRVETTGDLKECKVFVSAIPEEKLKETLEILKKRIYFLQKKLDKRLRMKFVPKISFFEEKKMVEAQRIEKILAELKKEKE
jgi:ribosome-binding factor A